MSHLKNARGQMTIETMLILIGLLAVEMMISKTAHQQKWMESLVGAPWKPVKAMIEDGTWTVQDSKKNNPSAFKRHASMKGDTVP